MNLLFAIKAMGLQGGGAERVLAEIAGGLVLRGHQVTLASFDAPGSTDFYPVHPQVARVRLGLGDTRRSSGPRDALRQVAALRRILSDVRPDAAIGFMHSAYIPLCFAASGTGVPVVASEHTVYGHYADKPFQALLLRAFARVPARFTGISSQMRGSFPTAIQRKMTVVANPVGAAGGRRADVQGGDIKTLLSVGRLSEEKGHETLIRAFASICPLVPGWRLRIVGEGLLRSRLEALARELGVAERVHIPGATNDVSAEYSAAQLFAVPSRYESFGLATAEALAHGLPAVGFGDCPGTNALIEHGHNGLLVSGPDRVAALADGLARLMGSDAERIRMAEVAPARLSSFSPGRIVEEWVALLSQLASAHAPAPGNVQEHP